MPSGEVAGLAREAATHAVRADGLLAEAHAALGWQEFWFGWNWLAAEASLRRATVLDPNYASAHRQLGHVLSNAGRHSEALTEMARARELDPFSPTMYMVSAQTAYHSKDFVPAERHARQSIALDPNFWAGHVPTGASSGRAAPPRGSAGRRHTKATGWRQTRKASCGEPTCSDVMGRRAEAQKLLREFEQKTPLVAPYEIAVVHAGLNDANGVFAALEKAYAVRDVNLVFLPVDPKWDPFRADPRFQALLDRCGFTRQRIAAGHSPLIPQVSAGFHCAKIPLGLGAHVHTCRS